MKISLKKFPWYRIIGQVIISVLMGLVIAYIMAIDFSVQSELEDNSYATIKFDTAESFSLSNCHFTNIGLITDGDNAKAEIENINGYVDYLELELATPVICSWKIKVEYTGIQNSDYRDENSISQWVSKYESRILIPVQQDVKNLRISFGNETNLIFPICSVIVNPSQGDYLKSLVIKPLIVKGMLYGVLFLIIGLMFTKQVTFSTLYRYRWLLGCIFLVFGVIFNLNGSSFAYYNKTLPGYDYMPLWGEIRTIRSDEFNVFTPMAFSQVASGFPWFSDLYRFSPMDMALTYGQLIKDPVIMMFRPFHIGYLLFGAERGLSFYWCSRLIICFLVSIEFGRVITNDKKSLAVAYAMLVTFAPVVQWWFSTNCLVEMLIYGQGAVVLWFYFLKNPSMKRKILLVFGMAVCAGGYVITLYPAWEIPFFYVFLICAICVIFSKKRTEKLVFTKSDLILIGCGLLIVAIGIGYIFIKSCDTLITTMNTVYPGGRNVRGGNLKQFVKLFRSWSNIFLPFTRENLASNQCEAAGFYDFFPLGMILSFIELVKEKRRDHWLALLMGLNVILLSFVLFRWPEILSKITLLNNCSIGRLIIVVGFLNLILLFRVLAELKAINNVFLPYLMIAIVCYFNCKIDVYRSYLTESMKVILMVFVALSILTISGWGGKEKEKNILALSLLIASISGLTVNPINFGADVVFDNPITRNIERINETNPGKWVVETSFPHKNLPTMVGASTLNSIQTYPDYQLWERLDLMEEEEIWNRYAHFDIDISEENLSKPELELKRTDVIGLTVDIDILKNLNINYILTKKELTTDSVIKKYDCDGVYIYEIH